MELKHQDNKPLFFNALYETKRLNFPFSPWLTVNFPALGLLDL